MNKLPNNLRQELQQLKAVVPDSGWKSRTHQVLLSELAIKPAVKTGRAWALRQVFSGYIKDITAQMTWGTIGALVLFVGIVVGPGIATVSASRGSLPGDILFPVKTGLEKVRISVTFSQTKKTELHISYVANRVHELERITKEQPPSLERDEKVDLALIALNKNTSTVKEELGKVEDNQKFKIALLIQEKTSDYQDVLVVAAAALNNEGDEATKADVTKALSSVQGVALDALDVMVEYHQENEDETISKDELKELVFEEIGKTKDLLEGLQDKIESDASKLESDSTKESVDTEEEATEKTVETEEKTKEEVDLTEKEPNLDDAENGAAMNENLDGLSNQLDDAKGLLEIGDLSEAVDKLADAKEQVDLATEEIRLDAIIVEEAIETDQGEPQEVTEETVQVPQEEPQATV